ncbi:hypothetical protein GE300_10075 [Rhodobacteraceae bacterium 2CG4]|uniref:Uncharacterized protein n=1 Tax=Halovulum marinum TaxID=2662447 RepID=A0A6L5Z1L2_9RHOB|nr:hypothetical protein [Halovulum marinum]MSU89955.1 hypothetical protein [Halovulum marinum]
MHFIRPLTTSAAALALGTALALTPVAQGVWNLDAALAQGKGNSDKDKGGDKGGRGGGRDKEERGRGSSGSATSVQRADRTPPGQAKKTETAAPGGVFVPPGQAKKSAPVAATTDGGARRVPPGQAKKATATEQQAYAEPLPEDGIVLEELEPKGKNIRAQLGALNAAHASENALQNASPNSRVGRIAAYRDEILAGREAAGELEEARALLETLDAPEREIDEIRTDLGDTRDRIETLREDIDLLEQAVADGTGDPDALAAARAELRELRDDRSALRDELTEAQDYAEAEFLVDELEDEILLSVEESNGLLDLAANKPVTDDVEVEVQRLLGLDGDPLADVVADVVADAEEEEFDDGTGDEPVIIVVD